MWQFCPKLPTYAIAHAKIKQMIIHLKIRWNDAHFRIILMDFWSSTNWAVWIQNPFTGGKNSQNTRNSTLLYTILLVNFRTFDIRKMFYNWISKNTACDKPYVLIKDGPPHKIFWPFSMCGNFSLKSRNVRRREKWKIRQKMRYCENSHFSENVLKLKNKVRNVSFFVLNALFLQSQWLVFEQFWRICVYNI